MILINEIDYIPFGNQEYVILNLINASCDIISAEVYNHLIQKEFDKLEELVLQQLLERKYLFHSQNDYNAFLEELDETINRKEMESTPNFLIVPTYACNLRCIYCYEQKYKINCEHSRSSLEIVKIQFERIKEILAQRSNLDPSTVRITLMGGEPLLKGNIETVRYVLEESYKNGYRVNAITNGVDLNHFIDDLVKYQIDHIQVTMDGTKELHDKRRIDAHGNGSFDKIAQNVKQALDKGISIDLRVNVDQTNVENLPKLADYLVENFSNHSNFYPYLYLLQDGGCSGNSTILNEEKTIYSILELEKQYPNMKVFNKQYHGSNFIEAIFSNEAFKPMLRHCAASKNQYILDARGDVYKCWHGIGDAKNAVGKFEPTWNLDKSKEAIWQNRAVTQFAPCKVCKYRYMCGTGCPAAEPDDNGQFNPNRYRCVDYKNILKALIITNLSKMNKEDL